MTIPIPEASARSCGGRIGRLTARLDCGSGNLHSVYQARLKIRGERPGDS